jgi:RNA polymerase sigma-70 factor, ECF subfamily
VRHAAPIQRVPETGDWADRLRAGKSAAFEQLFRTYYEQLVSFALRLVGTPDAAEEVVQDVFLFLWEHHERSALTETNAAAYLFGAVRKRATSHLRHVQVEQRWRQRVSTGEDAMPAGIVGATDSATRFNEVVAAARVAIDELQPRMRQAFLLRRQHGLSYVEIAQVMGISIKTVENHIGVALRTLRARLARFYD